MALLWADQPYPYDTAGMLYRWTNKNVTAVVSDFVPRANTKCIYITNNTEWVEIIPGNDGSIAPSGDTVIIQYRNRVDNFVDGTILSVFSGATEQIGINFRVDGKVEIRRGGYFGTTVATSTLPAFTATATFTYLEIKIKFNNGAGTADIRRDGTTTILNASGLNTSQSGTAWDRVRFGAAGLGGNPGQRITDILLMDGTDGTGIGQVAAYNVFQGDCTVDAQMAQSGNGSLTQWTCSTGTDHGALVDEVPENTTDWNEDSVSGNADSYNVTNLTHASNTILAVLPTALVTKDDAGTQQVKVGFYISSTQYPGAAIPVPSVGSWAYRTEIFTKNPNTAAQWIGSGVDGAEGLVKVA